jgi:hypothetical protein
MRASRAERVLGAALFLLFATPAFAQIGPPVSLSPAPPATTTPAGSAPSAPDAAAPSSSDDGISAQPLAPINSSWVGTLGTADRALPRDMWATTPKRLVAAALPLLQPTTSPVLQDLARRLLLSDAVAPPGQLEAGRPGLAALRVGRLLALGRIDGIGLLDILPQAELSEALERDGLELRFAANDVAGACRLARSGAARYRDPWWDRAVVACQALAGQFDEAGLGLSAMRDRKTLDDPVFATLIEIIDGRRGRVEKLPDPTPMRMALLAAAKQPLPTEALASAGPAALAVWATSDKVPPLQRLAAAERAEAFGAMPPDALGLLYGGAAVKPAERRAALAAGAMPTTPRARAILYAMARDDTAPAARVAALTPLLAEARQRGAFVTMARLVAPLVTELPAGQPLQGFAAEAARVLLAVGHPDQAAPWIDLANRPELRVLAALESPTPTGAAPPLPLKAAAASLTARDTGAAPRRIDLLIALATAFGDSLEDISIAPLLQAVHQGALPGAALWLDQQQAASGGRVGETVLATLLIAQSGDHLTEEPILLMRAIAGLRAVGLDADARAMAIEAALDAGI